MRGARVNRKERSDRTAWLRLNAYGVILAGLAVLSFADLFHPASTDLARLINGVPPGQPVWLTGFVVAGVMLMIGFVRGDRVAESLGLALLNLALAAQAVVAYGYLGVTEFTSTRLVILGILLLGTWARCSALWSRDGMTIHIPARGETEDRR